jgi:hypothetical protein
MRRLEEWSGAMCCTLEVELMAFCGDLRVEERRSSRDADWIFYTAQLLDCVGAAETSKEAGRGEGAAWPAVGDSRLDFLFGL